MCLFHQFKHHHPSDVTEFNAFLADTFNPDWIKGYQIIEFKNSTIKNIHNVELCVHHDSDNIDILYYYDTAKIYCYQLRLGNAEASEDQINSILTRIFVKPYSFDSSPPTKADLDSLCLIAPTRITARWTGPFDLSQVNFIELADGIPSMPFYYPDVTASPLEIAVPPLKPAGS